MEEDDVSRMNEWISCEILATIFQTAHVLASK